MFGRFRALHRTVRPAGPCQPVHRPQFLHHLWPAAGLSGGAFRRDGRHGGADRCGGGGHGVVCQAVLRRAQRLDPAAEGAGAAGLWPQRPGQDPVPHRRRRRRHPAGALRGPAGQGHPRRAAGRAGCRRDAGGTAGRRLWPAAVAGRGRHAAGSAGCHGIDVAVPRRRTGRVLDRLHPRNPVAGNSRLGRTRGCGGGA